MEEFFMSLETAIDDDATHDPVQPVMTAQGMTRFTTVNHSLSFTGDY